VAAGMVPFALGTQTTGSVLRPASFCGVFGFKPSFGDVSRSGVLECVSSFDTIGWFTRSVVDAEIIRQGLIRAPFAALAEKTVSQLRVGFFRGPLWDSAEGYAQNLLEDAVRRLMKVGANVESVEAPDGFGDIAALHRTVAGYEFARAISWERTQHALLLSPKLVDGRCRDGLESTYEDYASAQRALTKQRAAFAQIMQPYDVLLAPVARGEAPEGLHATGDPIFNTAWTALHVPALSIPAFIGPTGMPVGAQLIGGFRKDAALLAAAEAICGALDVGTVRGVPMA
jgi:amidase